MKQIHKKLLQVKKTISLAESCSGGLLASLLTSESGSSAYFLSGIVAYSNKSKKILLGVPGKLIAKYGSVSSNVAALMAENIRKKTNADLGLSITGIAGPAGAAINKPVGTVFICLSKKNKNICLRFSFRGNRQEIREKSVQSALRLLSANL